MPLAVFGAVLGVVLPVLALTIGDITLSAAMLTTVLNTRCYPQGRR
jgi:hypothetical protein